MGTGTLLPKSGLKLPLDGDEIAEDIAPIMNAIEANASSLPFASYAAVNSTNAEQTFPTTAGFYLLLVTGVNLTDFGAAYLVSNSAGTLYLTALRTQVSIAVSADAANIKVNPGGSYVRIVLTKLKAS